MHTLILRLVEVHNWDFGAFLQTAELMQGTDKAAADSSPLFRVTRNSIDFTVRLGMQQPEEGAHGYTELEFAWSCDIDLRVFDRSPSPRIVRGDEAWSIKQGGDVERVDYDGESGEARLFTLEEANLIDAQEAAKNALRERIISVVPLAADVINTLREAIRLELFEHSIEWDIAAEDLRASQRHLGWEEADVAADLRDASFLLAAFPRRGASRLLQEAHIEFEIRDDEGRSHTGVLPAIRSGHSTEAFVQSHDAIQARINQGSTPKEAALLEAIECLYGDNFRMAVLNAAAVFEFVVLSLYRNLTRPHSPNVIEIKSDYRRHKEDRKTDKITAMSKAILPRVLGSSAFAEAAIDRCLAAWRFRNVTAAHLTTPHAGDSLRRDEAWSMVTAVFSLLQKITE